MIAFINDILVKTAKSKHVTEDQYDTVIQEGESPDYNRFSGNVLLAEPEKNVVDALIEDLQKERPPFNVESITMASEKHKKLKKQVKKPFKVVKAAGGIVEDQEKILVMYRRGMWDLPKGKQEDDEDKKTCAVRETEEECNINVELVEKIAAIWHNYTTKNNRVLKKTTWYLMHLKDDSSQAPQTEEDIEEIRWMAPEEAEQTLRKTYPSLHYLYSVYRKMKEEKTNV